MSGILGLWNLDGRPAEEPLLRRLSGTLAHRGPDGEAFHIQGPIGLACQTFRVTPESLHETQPLVDSSGVAVLFDGRLDNREELLDGLPPDSPDSTLILAAYTAFAESMPEKLAGDFALAVWDPTRGRLLLARDAIGMRPLYYVRAGDTFVFASEIKALLAHPAVSTRPNDETLADYVLRFPGEDNRGLTFFQGIYSLPPAHLALLGPDRLQVRRYWDFDLRRPIRLRSFEEYREAFRSHFDRAVARRLRSAWPVAVSVSGGVDSSAIFGCAEVLHRRFPQRCAPVLGFSLTVPPEMRPSDEKAYLSEIERHQGVSIERLPRTGLGPMGAARQQVQAAESPLFDLDWEDSWLFLTRARDHGARVVLTGHWADQLLCSRYYLIDLARRLAWMQLRQHLGQFYAWYTDASPKHHQKRWRNFLRLFLAYHAPDSLAPLLRRIRPHFYPPPWDEPWYSPPFRTRVLETSFRWRSATLPVRTAHALSLYREVRARYAVHVMEKNNKVAATLPVEFAMPFLDRDLLAFLIAVPGEVLSWNGVPKGLLREALRDVLPDAIRERRWKADLTIWINEGLAREFPKVLEYIATGDMASRFGYVTPASAGAELVAVQNRIRGRRFTAARRVRDLLGLELWLQTFFEPATQRRCQ